MYDLSMQNIFMLGKIFQVSKRHETLLFLNYLIRNIQRSLSKIVISCFLHSLVTLRNIIWTPAQMLGTHNDRATSMFRLTLLTHFVTFISLFVISSVRFIKIEIFLLWSYVYVISRRKLNLIIAQVFYTVPRHSWLCSRASRIFSLLNCAISEYHSITSYQKLGLLEGALIW